MEVRSNFAMGKCKTVLRSNYTRLFVCANCVGFRYELGNFDQKLEASCNLTQEKFSEIAGIKFEFVVKGKNVYV